MRGKHHRYLRYLTLCVQYINNKSRFNDRNISLSSPHCCCFDSWWHNDKVCCLIFRTSLCSPTVDSLVFVVKINQECTRVRNIKTSIYYILTKTACQTYAITYSLNMRHSRSSSATSMPSMIQTWSICYTWNSTKETVLNWYRNLVTINVVFVLPH